MNWDGLNRRKFPRIVYPCLIKLVTSDGVAESFLTHTENIGVGGICLILKKELKMSSQIELEIDILEDAEHVKAKGRVVWVVKRTGTEQIKPLFYDIGIEFENFDEKEKIRLQDATELFIKKGYKILKPVY